MKTTSEANAQARKRGMFIKQLWGGYARGKDRRREAYLSLSVQLAKHIYKGRQVPEFQAYLALKFYDDSGKVSLSDAVEVVADATGKSKRTAVYQIQKCLENGWIAKGHAYYYVRSFKALERKFKADSRTSAILRYTDIKNFRQWIVGHFLASRYRHYRVRKKGRANTGKASGRECSVTIISDELNVSRTRAHQLKHEAIRAGYLSAKNRSERTNIHPAHKDIASALLDDPGLFRASGAVYRRLPDYLTFNLDAPGGNLRLLHFGKRPKYAKK